MTKKIKPLGPNHPVIVDINGQIEDELNDVRWQYETVKRTFDSISASHPVDKLAVEPTSYETNGLQTARVFDVAGIRRDFEDIAEMSAKIVVAINRIGLLSRRKLRLFADVDFSGGTDEIKAIRTAESEDESKLPPCWHRVGFTVAGPKWTPVKKPVGPYWMTREEDTDFGLVAYVRDVKDVQRLWPTVKEIHSDQVRAEITYTDRFPRPDWWKGE